MFFWLKVSDAAVNTATFPKTAAQALPVRTEPGIHDAGMPPHAPEPLVRVRELRHPLRRHERARLDLFVARLGERVEERELGLGGDERGLVLESVSRADLDD